MLITPNFSNGSLYLDINIGDEAIVRMENGSIARLKLLQATYDGREGVKGDWMQKAWARMTVGGTEAEIRLGEVKCVEKVRIGVEMIRRYSTDPWRRKRQNEVWKLEHDARIFAYDGRHPLVRVRSHVFPIVCNRAWQWDGKFYNHYARKTAWDLTPIREGVDIACPVGTQKVVAAHGGKIFFVGGYKVADERGSEGIGVFIRGDDNVCYLYFHLNSLADYVELGRRVDTGEAVGVFGNSGFEKTCEVPHLHFQMWLPRELKKQYECGNIREWDSYNDGFPVNPEPYLIEWHRG